jgi:small-conductance mechanosensitive channel
MSPHSFIRLFAAEGPPSSGSPAANPDDAGPTLVDLIIAFDPSPYLSEPMRQSWEFLRDYPWLFASLLVLTGFGIGWILKKLIHRLLNVLRASDKTELDYEIVHYLTQPILQTMVTFSLVLALAVLDFPGAIEHVLIRVCITVLLLLWGRAWFRATKVILQALEAERHRFHLFQPRTVPLYEMGIKLLLLGLFIYFVFLVWGIDATAWVASAGIIGIVVGFAARDTLANLISGVSIVADAPYKIGDYIVLESGERGLVVSLGIRSTRILTRDDVEISIPNALIGSAKIINESGGPWVRHRIRIPVGVAYDSDIDKVIEVLKAIAHDNENVVEEPSPRVRLRGFGNSSIDMELLCWINQPADRGMTVHHLIREIIKRFRAEQIEIPFPQRDLHFKNPRPGAEALQAPADS